MAKQIKTIKDFASYVKNGLAETLPDCNFDVKSITKDNGLCLTGIVVHKIGTIFAPIIYLNSYFAKLQAGALFLDVLNEIINDYEVELKEAANTNLVEIKDFSLIKDKICYRLINKESNSKLLPTIPHRDFYGLAVIYYINITSTDKDSWSVKITNDLAGFWNVDETQLYALASKNTPRLLKGCVTPLCDTLKSMAGLPAGNGNNDDRMYIPSHNFDIIITYEDNCVPMYIATNMCKTYGAAVIMYDGLLKSVSRLLGNFFVLPSSIHECIFVKGDRKDAERISQIVKEVNATMVSKEDVLSNSCWYYNAKNHTLETIK